MLLPHTPAPHTDTDCVELELIDGAEDSFMEPPKEKNQPKNWMFASDVYARHFIPLCGNLDNSWKQNPVRVWGRGGASWEPRPCELSTGHSELGDVGTKPRSNVKPNRPNRTIARCAPSRASEMRGYWEGGCRAETRHWAPAARGLPRAPPPVPTTTPSAPRLQARCLFSLYGLYGNDAPPHPSESESMKATIIAVEIVEPRNCNRSTRDHAHACRRLSRAELATRTTNCGRRQSGETADPNSNVWRWGVGSV